MAVNASEESEAGRSLEGFPGGQHGQTGEALIEWRSSEQVENGSPSTSPPYWDTDDDDDDDDDEDDEGAKPSELHEKYTWKIEKFSQLNKRELRSEIFEAGGYQWYILIYPQGCDVCNHLSLFLCVANHDKLLPGWSHFAQFTIAVVNKDPKKSKYSDTLHRFWKKEHDWGWRKFMELSKVFDGFIDSDTLIIKAQVQVIRERADRPFRCLDCQYRRELVRVYLSNVEQICRKFVEEKRAKLKELIEDKPGWSSFCAFWKGIDQNIKRHMSREKIGLILKVVVKHFFIEKEVTSTLVMDALYSGLKALESQSRCDKWGMKLSKTDEFVAPVVYVEKDMFVLVDDLLLLLERAAVEPLPPKDEKGPQNRTKDGSSGDDYNKDSIERDETRLTEMGRRTVETFVLAHIFSRKIEVAHQEAVALRRQEELIREEEEAGLVETEQKTKRRGIEKEKKAKQKQAKQKRNNRKGKDKGRDGKICATMLAQQVQDIPNDEMKDFMTGQAEPVLEKSESLGDVSVVSDSVDFVAETLQADTDGRDQSPISWDTDTSEVHPTTETSSSEISCLSCVQSEVIEKKRSSVMDDSSSSCSTDSVQSLRVNGHCKGNSISNFQTVKPPRRWRNQQGMDKHGCSRLANGMYDQPSAPMTDPRDPNDISRSSKVEEDGSEQHAAKKVEEEAVTLGRKLRENGAERPSKEKHGAVQLVLRNPQRSMPCAQLKSDPKVTTVLDPVPVMKPSPKSIQARDKPASSSQPQASASIRAAALTAPTSRSTTEKPVSVIPCPRQPSPVVSVVQTTPLPACSASSCTPQSYRNAIMGNSSSISGGFAHHRSPSSVHQDISFGLGGEDLSSVLNGVHSTVGSQECESSGCLAQVLLVDDFPHLDIINDLLDDDQGIPGSRGLSRQCSLPGDLSDGLCPMGSCRLERALSYRGDGRSSARLDEYVGPVSYVNGVLPNQWHVGASEVLFMGGVNSDVYSYRLPEWQNHGRGRGIHGFASMFPPSNGH